MIHVSQVKNLEEIEIKAFLNRKLVQESGLE